MLVKNNVVSPADTELGRESKYESNYNPDKLFAIPRKVKREEIGIIADQLPFYGFDCWNHYEVSWLNSKGKPIAAIAEIFYDCTSPNIIESKSMKLYFNSFNNTKFEHPDMVANTVKVDLEKRVGSAVVVKLFTMDQISDEKIFKSFDGECIDQLDVECTDYLINTSFLANENQDEVEEVLYSDILKSNCLVTNQPDWGSVQIAYKGKKINREGLLKYLVSFRNHNEFHEQCIERIFIDIMKFCHPRELTVHGRYTRRGGLDINPFRSTNKNIAAVNERLYRQ